MPALTEVSLPQGRVLYECGSSVESVYFPSSAIASVATVMSDGRSVETNTIGRESGIGLLNAVTRKPADSRVFVQVGGAAFRMSASALRNRVVESPSLNDLLLVHIHALLVQAEQFVACNALHNAEQRLARWLIMTADRAGGPSFPLTQEYMAVMAGVQRTTVSAIAAGLKSQGLIDYSRGRVQILDRTRLSATACECATIAAGQFKALREAGDNADLADEADKAVAAR